MAHSNPSGPEMDISSDPGPISDEQGYDAILDLKSDAGFRFDFTEDWRNAWVKVDFGHKKLVIGNMIYYAMSDRGRSYVTVYKLSYSLEGSSSTNFTSWVNPESNSELIDGIKEDTQEFAIAWLEPKVAQTLKYIPRGYKNRICFRASIVFCNGMSLTFKDC